MANRMDANTYHCQGNGSNYNELTKGFANDNLCMHLLRCLWFSLAYYDISISIVYVLGHTNCTADHLSRLFFSLHPQANSFPTPLPQALTTLIATPELNWTSASFRELFMSTIRSNCPPSSQKCHAAGQQCYLAFCIHCNKSPIPATVSTLLLFITHQAQQRISYTTMKVYLAALRSLHITTRHYNSYTQQLTPYLQQVLIGIKRDLMSTCPNYTRLPIAAFKISFISISN